MHACMAIPPHGAGGGHCPMHSFPSLHFIRGDRRPSFSGACPAPLAPAALDLQESAPPPEALDLLARMLDYDPATRISAADALRHEYWAKAPVAGPNAFMPPVRTRGPLGGRNTAQACCRVQPCIWLCARRWITCHAMPCGRLMHACRAECRFNGLPGKVGLGLWFFCKQQQVQAWLCMRHACMPACMASGCRPGQHAPVGC